MQADNLRRQRGRREDFQPLILNSLELKRNEVTGKIERLPDTSLADPFLSKFQTDQKERLTGTYRSPQMEGALFSYQTGLPSEGTSGVQSRNIYNKNAAILREGINRGGLESGANLISQREGLLSNLKARGMENYKNVNNSDLQLLSGIQNAMAPYQAIREQAMATEINDKNIRSQKRAQNMQLGGTVLTVIAIAAAA